MPASGDQSADATAHDAPHIGDIDAVTRNPGLRYQPPSVRAAEEERSHRLVLLIMRMLFMVSLITVIILTAASEQQSPEDFDLINFAILLLIAIVVGLIVLLVDARTPNKRLTSVVGVYLGICAGLLGALIIGSLIDVVAEAWEINRGRMGMYIALVKLIIAIVLCYFAVSIVLTTKDDLRLVIPYVEFSKQVRGVRPLLMDTSALIDGRINPLGQSGFLDAPLVLPEFVIDELQELADSSDKQKRARGRRGMEIVTQLQRNPYVDLSIDDTVVAGGSVDHKLLRLAADQKMRILTTDYNLNKVADIQGVPVLNLNDMANTLKAQALPGDVLHVEIVKRGEAPDQGVGYMPDGTMVVIEEAVQHIGEEVSITVTNSLQTAAGRMIFGRLTSDVEQEDRRESTNARSGGRDAEDQKNEGSAVGDDGDAAERLHDAATHQQRITDQPEQQRRKSIQRSGRNPRR